MIRGLYSEKIEKELYNEKIIKKLYNKRDYMRKTIL